MFYISKPEIKTAVKVYERSELKGSDWKFIVILILISNTYNLIKAKISKKKIKIIIQGISIFSTFCYTTFYLLSIIYNKNITEVYYYVINNLLAIVGIMVLICCIIQTGHQESWFLSPSLSVSSLQMNHFTLKQFECLYLNHWTAQEFWKKLKDLHWKAAGQWTDCSGGAERIRKVRNERLNWGVDLNKKMYMIVLCS